jgi:release factor glutamine methyltransferase
VLLAGELATAIRRLVAAGVDSPRADAEQLAAQVLDLPRGRLPLVTTVPAEAARRLRSLVGRRAERVPLQHLTGTAGFRYLELAVGPGVFVPRPETEVVVGWAIDELRRRPVGQVCVDLCAGSGAIALAIADEVPGALVHAVEADPGALVYLRRNAAAARRPVRVYPADLDIPAEVAGAPRPAGWAGASVLDALAHLGGRVDAVVANPPYLPDADRGALAPEVARHDPPWALWGGPDGLAGPLAVVAAARVLLRPGGLLAVEHADAAGPAGLAGPAGPLWSDGAWRDVRTHRDLTGRDRFVTARRA